MDRFGCRFGDKVTNDFLRQEAADRQYARLLNAEMINLITDRYNSVHLLDDKLSRKVVMPNFPVKSAHSRQSPYRGVALPLNSDQKGLN